MHIKEEIYFVIFPITAGAILIALAMLLLPSEKLMEKLVLALVGIFFILVGYFVNCADNHRRKLEEFQYRQNIL